MRSPQPGKAVHSRGHPCPVSHSKSRPLITASRFYASISSFSNDSLTELGFFFFVDRYWSWWSSLQFHSAFPAAADLTADLLPSECWPIKWPNHWSTVWICELNCLHCWDKWFCFLLEFVFLFSHAVESSNCWPCRSCTYSKFNARRHKDPCAALKVEQQSKRQFAQNSKLLSVKPRLWWRSLVCQPPPEFPVG